MMSKQSLAAVVTTFAIAVFAFACTFSCLAPSSAAADSGRTVDSALALHSACDEEWLSGLPCETIEMEAIEIRIQGTPAQM